METSKFISCWHENLELGQAFPLANLRKPWHDIIRQKLSANNI